MARSDDQRALPASDASAGRPGRESGRGSGRDAGERDPGAPTRIQVEKRKWDGSLSSTTTAWLVDGPSEGLCWFVPSGTARRGDSGRSATGPDEIWVAERGKWWVLCGESGDDGAIAAIEIHAAAPAERPSETLITWIDLDLDFVARGEHAELVDVDCFHARARTLGYPAAVVHAAWAGVSELAPRFTTREWPLDGTLETWLGAARARFGKTKR